MTLEGYRSVAGQQAYQGQKILVHRASLLVEEVEVVEEVVVVVEVEAALLPAVVLREEVRLVLEACPTSPERASAVARHL